MRVTHPSCAVPDRARDIACAPILAFTLVVTLLLAFAAPPRLAAQQIDTRNLGGGCGGTVGYPSILMPDRLAFFVQRSSCDSNCITFPSVVVLGVRRTHLRVPFGPGIVPGCILKVEPLVSVPIGGTLHDGHLVWLGELGAVPRGLSLYVQALPRCCQQGRSEYSASDAWRLRFR